ncbi:hypothetical protein B0T25DRAFT_47753 [Lasiosphaeria hispida]|uniref:Uncharacterized protein n=1 Tax=Lasiosphaeria hispida TaxID=260671 RepID=A0AAJ0HVQ8_9PEZI|nr:hypothetical protein B0T25DRAFT_47753 [Lasiosphaeria hispida]
MPVYLLGCGTSTGCNCTAAWPGHVQDLRARGRTWPHCSCQPLDLSTESHQLESLCHRRLNRTDGMAGGRRALNEPFHSPSHPPPRDLNGRRKRGRYPFYRRAHRGIQTTLNRHSHPHILDSRSLFWRWPPSDFQRLVSCSCAWKAIIRRKKRNP